MNSLSQINLQIKSEPEKAADFFISLYKFKKKHSKIPPTLFPLDGIELDEAPITLLKPTKEDLKNSETKVKELYDFLSGLEDAQKYQLDNYKEFKEDTITKVLQEEIILFDICKRIFNSGEISLFNTCMSLTTDVLDNIGIDAIGETFARQMLIIYLNTIKYKKDYSFETGIPKADAFALNSTYFDQHYYYEKEGMLIPFTEKTSPDYFLDYYIQKGEDVVRCKTNTDEEVMEITIFSQATIQDQKLIIANPTIIAETLYIPSNESASFFAALKGEILESEKEVLPDLSSDDRNENSIPIASYVEGLHRYAHFVNHQDKDAKQALSDRCIFHFYRMIKSGFPSFSEIDLKVVTGYLCSLLGVLYDRKQFSKQADFSDYLKNSVQKAFNRHS